MNKELSSTLENYLEAILNIIAENNVVRIKDISERLNVRHSAVSAALHSLAEKGMIIYAPRTTIILTEKGRNIAQCINNRHHLLKRFFISSLHLPESDADKAACEMEHGMTSALCKKFADFIRSIDHKNRLKRHCRQKRKRGNDGFHCDQTCCTPDRAVNETVYHKLNLISPGKSAHIARILNGPLKKRFSELGITAGQRVTVVRVAPFGTPIEIRIRNYHLSLRREDAENILVTSN